MQKRESTGNQIFALIANKYNVQPDDLDGLLKAVTEDKDLFAEKALAAGVTTEEARNDFFNQQKTNAQEEELETLRREKAARELDTHLRTIAAETQKEFPNFNLEDEFQNPTPLDGNLDKWKLAIAIKCFDGRRKRSMVELLFCMLRSGR